MNAGRPKTKEQRLKAGDQRKDWLALRPSRAARSSRPPSLVFGSRFLVAQPAFTLVELLVAAGLTALIGAFIAIIIRNVGATWTRASGRLSADAQARIVLDQLTTDLQGALFREDGNVWLAATVLAGTGNSGLWDTRGASPGLLKPSAAAGTSLSYTAGDIANATFGTAGVWLRFFTSKRGTNSANDPANTLSAPVAVGWQIVRRAASTNANNSDRRYFLQRAEVRSGPSAGGPGTLDSGFNITSSAYAGLTATSSNAGALGDPLSVRVPRDPSTIVAENVIDFGVRFFVADAATGNLMRIFPAANETSHLATAPPRAGAATTQFPEVVDVIVRILTDEGAKEIAQLEAGGLGTAVPARVTPATAPAWWWHIALANSRVYTRRIVIQAKPL